MIPVSVLSIIDVSSHKLTEITETLKTLQDNLSMWTLMAYLHFIVSCSLCSFNPATFRYG